MSKQDKTVQNKKKMILALTEHNLIVVDACKTVGIGRQTHYDWLKQDEQYKKDVEEIELTSLNYVRSKLMERINGVAIQKIGKDEPVVYDLPPDVTAIIFYLKAKGKKFGWNERVELDHTTKGESINVISLGSGVKPE